MNITVKVVATDSAVTALSVAIDVTLKSTSLSQHFLYNCCPSAVTLLLAPSLSQRCACFRCHNAVLVSAATTLCSFTLPHCDAVLVYAATTLCSFPLPQCCARLRCHTVTLCSFTLSQRCTHWCLTAMGILPCTNKNDWSDKIIDRFRSMFLIVQLSRLL